MACAPAFQISRKSWARQDQLCHLASFYLYSNIYCQNFQIFHSKLFYSKLILKIQKMTRTKKTLGQNWTRYHNYYGVNYILERACTQKLHWDRKTLQDYTINHAPEVNHQNAMKHVKNPPPLPDNDDDAWFKSHPKLLGSGKAPCKQPQSKTQTKKAKKKGKAQGGGKKLPASQKGMQKTS